MGFDGQAEFMPAPAVHLLDGAAAVVQGVGQTVRVADVAAVACLFYAVLSVRDRTAGASSRTYRFSANVQVIIDADTRLVVASARPAPGNKADAHVWRESDLPALTAGTTAIADGAYLGAG